jgi:hypothetical protein
MYAQKMVFVNILFSPDEIERAKYRIAGREINEFVQYRTSYNGGLDTST